MIAMWSVKIRPKTSSESWGRGLRWAASWTEIMALNGGYPAPPSDARPPTPVFPTVAGARRSVSEGGRHRHRLLFAQVADQRERRRLPGALFRQQLVQIVDAGDGRFAKADDKIALAHAGRRRRAVRFDRHHEHTGLCRQLVIAHHPPVQRHVLTGEPDVRAPDVPIAD